MLGVSSTLQLPRSRRPLELAGLAQMLHRHPARRVVVAGGPRAGKSTLAEALKGDRALLASDHLRGLGWSEASEAASFWFDRPGSFLAEGVAMPRALRKWLARTPDLQPADLILFINDPVVARSRGQHVMALGVETVWREIEPELRARGVEIIEA